MDESIYMFVNLNVDVVCVPELLFQSEINDLLIWCEGFTVFRANRSNLHTT